MFGCAAATKTVAAGPLESPITVGGDVSEPVTLWLLVVGMVVLLIVLAFLGFWLLRGLVAGLHDYMRRRWQAAARSTTPGPPDATGSPAGGTYPHRESAHGGERT